MPPLVDAMYRSAGKTTINFRRHVCLQLSGCVRDRLPPRLSSNFKLTRRSNGNFLKECVTSCKVLVEPHPTQDTLLLTTNQRFLNPIAHSKAPTYKFNASFQNKDFLTGHLPWWMVRSLSGRCNERENIDENQVSPTDGTEKEDDKEGSKAENGGQQLDTTSLSSETEEGRNEKQQQEISLEKLRDLERRKGDRKLRQLKTSFKRQLAKRVLSWEKIDESFENFPYYISDNTKDLLIECASARLKHFKYSGFGKSLPSASHLVCLHGPPGTEIYQEKLVRALTRHLEASLLVLDSEFLAPKDHNEEIQFSESDSGGDDDDETDTNEDWQSHGNGENDEDEDDSSEKPKTDVFASKIRKMMENASRSWIPGTELRKRIKKQEQLPALKIGDRVKFIGKQEAASKVNRTNVRLGQPGVVVSVSHGLPWKVGVKFDGNRKKGGAHSKKRNGGMVFCDAGDLQKAVANPHKEEWLFPIEALCEMVTSSKPVVVYFPDIQHWFARAVPAPGRGSFLDKVGEYLNKVKGPVVFISGSTKEDTNTSERSEVLGFLLTHLWSHNKRHKMRPKHDDEERLKGTEKVWELFKNKIRICPPVDAEMLRIWKGQLEQDKKATLVRKGQKQLQKVLVDNGMICPDLSEIDTLNLQLTKTNSQMVVGWARNNYLYSQGTQVKDNKLIVPRESLGVALSRFKALETKPEERSKDISDLAENEYESSLTSSVIPPQEIGVKFDQIGALEDVKKLLNELIVIPLQRPELFKRGNLRKPCKGVLLFGPPGTGKTLLAKAVATEAGANFLNITVSNLTSKWYGDAEKLVVALFSLARKLAPAVIFFDEVDSLLGARGQSFEHEATRKVRTEFMAAWDGLQSKETERILVLASTNRPFDLDDAVIRRLPRRILIDLPNLVNREKILRTILAEEDLVEGFNFNDLASQTEGYSGSDLKNLCIAAAYRPVREFLEEENKAKMECLTRHAVRSLCLEDFIQAKSTVGASVSYDATTMIQLRKWNELYGEGGNRKKSVFGFAQ